MRVPRRAPGEGEVTGWCLETHDLVLAKCAAGRERDWEFAEDAIRYRVVSPEELLRRTRDLPLSDEVREHVQKFLGGIITRARGGGEPA